VQSVVEHIGAPLREDGYAVASLLVPDDALFTGTLRGFVESTVRLFFWLRENVKH